MRILQIDLDNVKSYRHAEIPFAPGTNAICGHNGAGKSTLLEAIGFALFDFLAVKRDDFVREGEKTATVTVRVTGTDGRVYHIVRRCGGSSQYYVYDPELDQRLTEGKAETVTWLREFLDVDPATDLAVLFRDAVGVPQGLLTSAFLETASRRKEVFNPLLRVDEYERVWGALRDPRRRLEHQIADVEKTIAGLEAEVRALPDLRTQLADLSAQIAQNTQQQAETQATLQDVTARKGVMETLKLQLAALEKAVTQAEAILSTLTAQHSDAQVALERSEAAQVVVVATAEAHQAYLATEGRLRTLEDERQARDKLQRDRQARGHEQDLTQQSLARLEQTLAEVADAEAEMAALAPQVEAQTRLDMALEDTRRAVERLKSAERTLTRERGRLAEMETRLNATRVEVEKRAAVETELQSAQAELDATATQRDALAMQLAAQQAESKAVGTQVKQTLRLHKDAQRILDRTQQRLVDLEAKHDTLEHDLATLAAAEAQVETAQAAIVALDEQERAHTAQLAADQTQLNRLQTQRTALMSVETAKCPVCNAPLSPEHRGDLLAQNRTRVADLEVAIAHVQVQQRDVAKARRDQELTLRALDKQIKRLPRTAEREEVVAHIAAQHDELAVRQGAVAEAQAEVTALEARQATLEEAVDELQPRLTEVERTRAKGQRVVRDLERQLKALPRPAELEVLVSQVEVQRQTVAESERTVAELHSAPDELARLETELAALGDPRRAYQRAADIAAQREATTDEHTNVVTRLGKLAAQCADLNAALAAHADLDDRLAATRADRETHAPDHQRYLQHEREAAGVSERRAARDALAAEMQTTRKHFDEQCAARDEVAAQYDCEAYDALVAQHGALRETLAGLEASLQFQQTQRATVKDNIARLEEKQRDLDEANVERDDLTETQALLEYLRQVLRDAGPAVTRALVEMISLHADRLFADIMQTTAARLRWTEDYDIVLTTQGRERGFQQLSGGEQMSAALAVRLALLREISTVDIAFFDEPTANLDRDRRANLARQVLNIQGFGQLFVISHDDTFEQDTDFVVRIEKVDGVSRRVV